MFSQTLKPPPAGGQPAAARIQQKRSPPGHTYHTGCSPVGFRYRGRPLPVKVQNNRRLGDMSLRSCATTGLTRGQRGLFRTVVAVYPVYLFVFAHLSVSGLFEGIRESRSLLLPAQWRKLIPEYV